MPTRTIRPYLTILLLLALAFPAAAEVVIDTVTYEHDGVRLQGVLAYDDAIDGPRPGVLIMHQWMGLTDYEVMRARMLAELGFTAFAADMYGVGNRPGDTGEAAETAKTFYDDRELMRTRAAAGLDRLRAFDGLVNPDDLAVIGYCFGGTCALELGRHGANVDGIVSFHGGLSTPHPRDAKDIRAKILVAHGAKDPHVPWSEVQSFAEEMNNGGVDWFLVAYGDAVHAFTQPMAGDDQSDGVAYNEAADKDSWKQMKLFFDELF